MKRRYILLAVTAALVFAVAAGGTLAANQVESNSDVSTPLSAKTLTISLDGGTESNIRTVPGSEISVEEHPEIAFSVKNAGDINAFVRVTITKYWETPSGKVLSAENVNVDYGADDNWIQVENQLFEDPDTKVFYYKQPLTADTTETSSLIKSVEIDGLATGNTYADATLHIEAVADGVQYAAGYDDVNEDAILGSWGVQLTVENGTLATTDESD